MHTATLYYTAPHRTAAGRPVGDGRAATHGITQHNSAQYIERSTFSAPRKISHVSQYFTVQYAQYYTVLRPIARWLVARWWIFIQILFI